MSDNKPWLSSLAFIGFEVNAAIARGHADAFSFQEIYQGLENRTLLDDLKKKLPDEFDFSLFTTGTEQANGLYHVLHEAAGGLEGRERKKVGIETSGLHLLLAFVLECMQHKMWVPGSS